MQATVAVKERPILMSAPMVRALLDGRKTQTRRVVKCVQRENRSMPGHFGTFTKSGWNLEIVAGYKGGQELLQSDCPYGEPGDRLWVREVHAIMSTDCGSVSVAYRERLPHGKTLADTDGGLDVITGLTPEQWHWADAHIDYERWRPSIFMPRWASRITLEITEMRVQRLQEISEADAVAEGIYRNADGRGGGWKWEEGEPTYSFAISAYRELWESINGPGSWAANPWVWAVGFKVVQP